MSSKWPLSIKTHVKTMYITPVTFIYATCPAHLILLDLISQETGIVKQAVQYGCHEAVPNEIPNHHVVMQDANISVNLLLLMKKLHYFWSIYYLRIHLICALVHETSTFACKTEKTKVCRPCDGWTTETSRTQAIRLAIESGMLWGWFSIKSYSSDFELSVVTPWLRCRLANRKLVTRLFFFKASLGSAPN